MTSTGATGTPGSAYAFIPEEVFKNPRPKPNAASAATTTTTTAGAAAGTKVVLKVFLKSDQTFKTIAATSQTTTTECLAMVSKKLGLSEALAGSLTLVERDNKDQERVLDANERPGGLQLQWQTDKVDKKFLVKFSEEGKDTLRKTALKRLSITTKAETPASTSASSSSNSEPTPSQRIAADLSELDMLAETFAKPSDDLATLDAITADFAAAPKTTSPVATRPAALQNTKISKTGQTRVKMVPIDKDDEFQGLLTDLKSSPAIASSSSSSSSSSSASAAKPSTPAKPTSTATTSARTAAAPSTTSKMAIPQTTIGAAKPIAVAKKTPTNKVVDAASFGDLDDMLSDAPKSHTDDTTLVGIDESQFKINDADFMPVTPAKETKKASDIDMAAFDSVFARLDLAGLNEIEESVSSSISASSDFDFDSVLEKLAASLDDNQF